MESLIESYKKDRREIRSAITKLEKEAATYPRDDWHRDDCRGRANNLTWLIANLDFGISWMEYRYVEPNKAEDSRYHQSFPVDPFTMEKYMHHQSVEIRHMEREDVNRIHEALRTLSARERECYELHVGQMLDEYEIASMLNISRSSVQTFLMRAEKKITTYRMQPEMMTLDIAL